MKKKVQRIVEGLSTTAALIAAIVEVLKIIVRLLPSQEEKDGE